ncbi:hypothetical protein [Anaerotignum propionicum]|uniref:hypothetical protein n=1 Tax=Anaerotignum propionicum TaxID=28446 RepID=UPI000824C4F2|nr:hypothetical protein [Anaerotignum propionicum]MEA5056608.1 hypothetical protein [Anaerotignum propionicum]
MWKTSFFPKNQEFWMLTSHVEAMGVTDRLIHSMHSKAELSKVVHSLSLACSTRQCGKIIAP